MLVEAFTLMPPIKSPRMIGGNFEYGVRQTGKVETTNKVRFLALDRKLPGRSGGFFVKGLTYSRM